MNKDGVCVGINAFQYVLTALQLENALRIVTLILSIISTVVILIFKIMDWYKKAKEDGRITTDEVREIIKDTKEDTEKIIEDIKQVSQEVKKEKDKNA